MASAAQLLRDQIAFMQWANQRILSAAAALTPEELNQDFKTSDKSILGTLTHCYRAERAWLNRMHDTKVDFRLPGDDSLEALQGNWPNIAQGWVDWVANLTDEAASAELQYSDLKGNLWKNETSVVVLHVVNHSTHHRGQVSGFLRALGHTPPNVDLISFAREKGL